ncbi:MAG: TlpA family protein disulfide reductase [Flavobacteriales bacterium]|jgi:thiol-disulfide isomerase/thioredoxin|nr:TlpA family protein disulfide reductase [Flavobacteriales bacterium]
MKSFFKLSLTLVVVLLLSSCSKEQPTELKQGVWRGEIDIQGNALPFNFEVLKKDDAYSINLMNSKETIPLDEVTVLGDSVFITMHIFDIDIRAKINGNNLTGLYIKNYADNYRLSFKATFGKNTRFDNPHSDTKFDGSWETTFVNEEGREIPAKGVFKTEGNLLTGTILTKTGDYRYLEGYTENNKLHLYTFDGNHAFVFIADMLDDGSLKGNFHSGRSSNDPFTAVKNPDFELPNALALTYLKEGFDKVSFSFPGLDGKPVSLDDAKYKGKVVVLQVFGTWCPNCMDETVFYADWYAKNKDKGVAIIGLAYENPVKGKFNFDYAKKRVEKMKKKYNLGYDYVLAGISKSTEASKSLPMLNKIISFPTSIIIDRNGKVRRIHTGFAGPATGKYYEDFVEDFNSFMAVLIAEKE